MISIAVDFEMINRVLPVTFDDGFTLAVDFALDPATMAVYFGEIVPTGDLPAYTGSYNVDPKFTAQKLATNGKKMRDDVTVEAIEVQRVSNTSGGRTVYIGGLING